MLARFFLTLSSSALLLVLIAPASAFGAEFTDLLDAADDLDDGDPDTYKAWDFHIEPTFRFDHTTAQIGREAPCVPSDSSEELRRANPRLVVDPNRCGGEARIVTNREMLYRSTRSTLDMTLRAGLYKDLELRVTVPYVIQSTRSLRYDNVAERRDAVVDQSNSSVDPSSERIRRHADNVFSEGQSDAAFARSLDQFQLYRFFDLSSDFSTYERSGFGDPSVGLHWGPWNDYRDDTKATMLIGMDYVIPLAAPQQHNNISVGRGVHELQWKVAASKKFDWFEPYFGAQYFLPLPASNSLYGRVDTIEGQGAGQVLRNPPQRGLFTIGTEIIPHEDPAVGARYAFDLRFQFGYVSEGRDYTPLFDHMTDPTNDCNQRTIESVRPQFDSDGNITNPDDVACAWVVRQPSNARNLPVYDLEAAIAGGNNDTFAFTDLMSVDSYGTFGGQLGVYLQPTRYFQFRGVVGLTHHQSHLITNARTGRNTDATDQDSVAMTDRRERNPAYNPSYDNSGDRFNVQRHNTWHFQLTTAIQF